MLCRRKINVNFFRNSHVDYHKINTTEIREKFESIKFHIEINLFHNCRILIRDYPSVCYICKRRFNFDLIHHVIIISNIHKYKIYLYKLNICKHKYRLHYICKDLLDKKYPRIKE